MALFDGYQKIGTFEFSDTVDICDPWHPRGCWCRRDSLGIVPGRYVCLVGPLEDGYPTGVLMHLEGTFVPDGRAMACCGRVAADTAEVGVFDAPLGTRGRCGDFQARGPVTARDGALCACTGADGDYPVMVRVSAEQEGDGLSPVDAIWVPFA